MTIRDLVKSCNSITLDTEFYVEMPEHDHFHGTVEELPRCVTSIEITEWAVINYNPRSFDIKAVGVAAKEYKYAFIEAKV